MKIELLAHAFYTLTVSETRAFQDFVLATKAKRGEVVGVAWDVQIERGAIVELPSRVVYGRTPDGISRYPLSEVGPRWAVQALAASVWAQEEPKIERLVQAVGRVMGDGTLEVIHLRDVLVVTRIRTPTDLGGPGTPPLAEAVRRGTVIALPGGLTLTRQIHALGGAAHVIGERLFRITRGLPEGPLRQVIRQARVVVIPPETGIRQASGARRAAV